MRNEGEGGGANGWGKWIKRLMLSVGAQMVTKRIYEKKFFNKNIIGDYRHLIPTEIKFPLCK